MNDSSNGFDSETASGIRLDALQSRVEQLTFELSEIKNSRSHRLIERMKRSRLLRLILVLMRLIVPSSEPIKDAESLSRDHESLPSGRKKNLTTSIGIKSSIWSAEEISWLENQNKHQRLSD
jgi:hypothetical protein